MVWLMVEPLQLDSTKGQRSLGWTKVVAELDFISRGAKISTTLLARPRTGFLMDILEPAPTERLSILSDHAGAGSVISAVRPHL